MARFLVPGIVSVWLSWSLVQLEEPLVTAKACEPVLHPQGYHSTLIVVVAHRYHSWVDGWLLPPLEECMVPPGALKASLLGGDIWVSFSSGASTLFLMCMVSSAIGT